MTPRAQETSRRWISLTIVDFDQPRLRPELHSEGHVVFRSDFPAGLKPGAALAAYVLTCAAVVFQINPGSLSVRGNHHRRTEPFQAAIYVYRKTARASYPQLARLFRRHHTTCMYAYETVESRRSVEPEFDAKIRQLEEMVAHSLNFQEEL